MEIEEKYNELIIKYLDNRISSLELEVLSRWLKADKNNFKQFVETKDLWDSAELSELSSYDAETALAGFHNYAKGVSKPLKNSNRFIRYAIHAAATILLAVLLSLTYQGIKNLKTTTHDASIGYAEVSIPNGHKGQITLPDGTEVWLNSNTSLRYAAAFDGDDRKIYLDGEAFFDVAKDPERPFLVETSTITLRVLGTSFNVKSYSGENMIETTLIEGSLKIEPSSSATKKIEEVTLNPNEKATFIKSENVILIEELDVTEPVTKNNTPSHFTPDLEISQLESIISWKDNELIFRNETLQEICIKMERWYGISIRIEDEKLKGKAYRYNGKFIYNETVNQVMDILVRTTPIKYTQDKNVLIIKGKN